MKNVDAIRIVLTFIALVVLGICADWTWFWAFFAMAVFSESWGLGYKFLQKRR